MRWSTQSVYIWTQPPVVQLSDPKIDTFVRTLMYSDSAFGPEGGKDTDPVLMHVDARPRPYLVQTHTPTRQRLQEHPIVAVVRESICLVLYNCTPCECEVRYYHVTYHVIWVNLDGSSQAFYLTVSFLQGTHLQCTNSTHIRENARWGEYFQAYLRWDKSTKASKPPSHQLHQNQCLVMKL